MAEGTGRGFPVLVIALAAICIFTPQIREPILDVLDVNAAAPFHATERFVAWNRQPFDLGP
jgi:hypothetical protein